jgi:hypothetical protein
MTAKYFDRNGDEIDERHAVDRSGALRDGVVLHVPLQMRDGLSPVQLSVRDAAARDARAQAYATYDQEIQQAYKHGSMRDTPTPWAETDPRGRSTEATGFGSNGPRGQSEGDVCTINGVEGRLRTVNGRLRCVPLRSSSDSRAQFTDGSDDPTQANRPGWRLRVGDTRQAVRDALRDYENDLVNRWRGPDADARDRELSVAWRQSS